MTDIFISYKREDRKRAHAIAGMFASHGYDVWWDIELLPGQKFADEINSVISKAKAVVVLWTPKSILSDWVKAEAAIAFDRSILIPAWLEKVTIPAPYNTLHTIDLAAWNGTPDDPILDGLLAGVNSLIDKPVNLNKQLNEEEILAVLNKPAHEVEFWQAISNAKKQSISEYEAYLKKYGSKGVFSELASLRILQLGKNRKAKKFPKPGKILTFSGIAIGIIVGVFQISEMLGRLPSNSNDLLLPSVDRSNPETTEDRTKIQDIVPNIELSSVSEGSENREEKKKYLDPTNLIKQKETIFDKSTNLFWAKNIYSIGFTKDLFKRNYEGSASLEQDLHELNDKASGLLLDGVSGWRLASYSEIDSLRKIDKSAVFLAFYTHRPGPSDVIGIYRGKSGRISSWGYQHANYLQGPYESGWIQGNDYGVWLVTSSENSIEPTKGEIVYSRPEPQIEQILRPILKGVMFKEKDGIKGDWQNVSVGLVGNLESEDTRSIFEYNLKPIGRGGYVRAELVLEATQSSGNGSISISIYDGDGLFRSTGSDDWNPDDLISNKDREIVHWDGKRRTRVELPSHILRNFFNTKAIVGLHFKYSGKGNIRFKPPKLIVTYVKEENLLTRFIDR